MCIQCLTLDVSTDKWSLWHSVIKDLCAMLCTVDMLMHFKKITVEGIDSC